MRDAHSWRGIVASRAFTNGYGAWRNVRAAFQNPIGVLSGLVVLNAAAYLLLFVRPLNLPALYSRPLLDLRQLSVTDPHLRWRLVAAFLLLALLYWLCL